jgi:predicted ribosomally synthesized peptide with nif11-like leader
MSIAAVEAFRKQINTDDELKQKATVALHCSVADVVALGAEYKHRFTEEEANEFLASLMNDGELSDYELELVSAGTGCPTVASA